MVPSHSGIAAGSKVEGLGGWRGVSPPPPSRHAAVRGTPAATGLAEAPRSGASGAGVAADATGGDAGAAGGDAELRAALGAS
jgi:hypothetical protein